MSTNLKTTKTHTHVSTKGIRSLARFQENFVKSMIKNQTDAPFLSNIIPAHNVDNPETILQVHRQGYVARLTEALGETYEATWWVLGDEEFFKYCEKFILENPSSVYNLSNYGKGFSDFLQTTSEMPFLKVLASFEWEFKEFFHQKLLFPKKSNALNKDQFELSPQSQLLFNSFFTALKNPYKIFPMWKLRYKSQDEVSEEEFDQLNNFEGDEFLIIHRGDKGLSFVRELSRPQFELLTLMQQKLSLDRALEILSKNKKLEISSQEVQDLFHFIFYHGLVKEVITNN